MSMSDPIADMLTRIRNAYMAKHDVTEVSHSNLRSEMARILKREGYIADFVVDGGGPKKNLRIYLKYVREDEPVLQGIRRVSKPGLRQYVNAREVPKVLGGLGILILSTSAGVLTDEEARKKNVGGEILCEVW